jgi:hypothetical protein
MLSECGVIAPEILLPENTAYDRWAVIACDQFTQDRAYWNMVEQTVGGAPSTLHITLPEIDLALADVRVPRIRTMMNAYRQRVLTRRFTGFTLVRRTFGAKVRNGLVLAVDLERYDYAKGSQSLIRATEGTIVERLPPRMKIRRGACLECPHIMLLIDDPEKTVIEPLFEHADQLEKLYDFELMMGGGRAEGWGITDASHQAAIARALAKLAEPERQKRRYGDAYDGQPLLFAVGDGNHSLATAKACWEELKPSLSQRERETHPARFALAEVCNLHDAGLHFEPIHRIVLGVDPGRALEDFARYLKENEGAGGTQSFAAMLGRESAKVVTARAPHALHAGSLQGWLDGYIANLDGAEVDYIHGEAEVRALAASREDALAFLLPAIDKNSLFAGVMRDGALPRKTFSMGEAREKRYYLECREIARG